MYKNLVVNQNLSPRFSHLLCAAWFSFLLFLPGAGALAQLSPRVIEIDAAREYQMIENVGASGAWAMQFVGQWTETNRSRVADLLFSKTAGAGLSCWRFPIGAGQDGNRIRDPWRASESFLVSTNGQNWIYDWNRQAGDRWFLKAAKARGVTQFVAMAYSPPLCLTRNGHANGTKNEGSTNLKEGCAPAFAKYLADVLEHFATNPVPEERVVFDYISPFNEPYWEWDAKSNQEGCRFANDELIEVCRVLHAELLRRGLSTKILTPEAGDLPGLYAIREDITRKFGKPYGDYMSAFSQAHLTNVVAPILAAHSYFTDEGEGMATTRQTLHARLAQNPQWRYWMTEYCILGARGPGRDLTMATALDVARVIHADLSIADASAWHWWLSVSRYNYKDGLIYTDFATAGDAESIYPSKALWALGHFSRFIPPGSRRIEMSGTDASNDFLGSAYRNPNGTWIAVLINGGKTPQPITLKLKNVTETHQVNSWVPYVTSDATQDSLRADKRFSNEPYVIPARSVVTLVGGTNSGQ